MLLFETASWCKNYISKSMCLPREHELPRVTANIFPHKRTSLNEMPAVQSHIPGKPTGPSSLVFSATEKQTPVWFHLVLQSFILFFLLWGKKKYKNVSPVQHCTVCYENKTKKPPKTFHLCRILMKVIPMWRACASYSCGDSHSRLIHISVDFSKNSCYYITQPAVLIWSVHTCLFTAESLCLGFMFDCACNKSTLCDTVRIVGDKRILTGWSEITTTC